MSSKAPSYPPTMRICPNGQPNPNYGLHLPPAKRESDIDGRGIEIRGAKELRELVDRLEAAAKIIEQLSPQVVNVKPGDTIFIRSPVVLSDVGRVKLREAIAKAYTGCHCVVLDGGLSVEAIVAEETQ